MEKNYKKFNINEYVYLKMEDSDFKMWKEHHDSFLPARLHRPIEDYKNKVDENGYVRMQMHEYIQTFQSNIGIGCLLPCLGNVYFEDTSIDEISRLKALLISEKKKRLKQMYQLDSHKDVIEYRLNEFIEKHQLQ